MIEKHMIEELKNKFNKMSNEQIGAELYIYSYSIWESKVNPKLEDAPAIETVVLYSKDLLKKRNNF